MMTRFSPRPVSACLALLFLLAACSGTPRPVADAAPAQPARAPNILLIVADDMGWRDWSGGGSRFYRTPNLDALAARGMRFDQAYSAAAVCSPSRAALMTGRSPARLHITDWIPGNGMPHTPTRFREPDWTKALPDLPTLPGDLRTAGYRTAFIGKWHLGDGPAHATRRGFDTLWAGGETGHPASYFWPYGDPGNAHRVPDLAEAGGQPGEYLTDRLTDDTIAWLRQHGTDPDRPFFLVLSHYAVHDPLQATDADLAAVADWTPEGGQHHRTYAAMLHALDRSIGRLMATLRETGIDDNTLVVFVSDNGALALPDQDVSSNLPLREGKRAAYEGGIRVPMIIAGPGMPPGRHSPVPVSGIDVMPTLLDLAGVPARTGVDGVSLAGLLRTGTAPAPRRLLWHFPHYGTQNNPWSVLREGTDKLIHYYEDDRWELYDLARDPGEHHNLATRDPKRLARLQAALADELARQDAQPLLPRSPP